ASGIPSHVLLPRRDLHHRHAPHAERARRSLRREPDGNGGPGGGGGGDPARGRPGRHGLDRSGGLPGADSRGRAGHLPGDGGPRGQLLDGHHGRGVRREPEQRGAAAHAHGARGVRCDRREGEAQAGPPAGAGDPGGAHTLRAGPRAPGADATAVSARVVVLLSGGGAKAAAHVGALRALTEAGLAPTQLVATSMGAVIAAAFAAGLGLEEILERIEALGTPGIVSAPWAPFGGLWLRSLLRGEPLRDAIAALVPARSFAELRTPLLVTAVNLDTGDLIRFGAGGESAPLVDALWASCALPVFYPPVSLGGRRLVDGGLRGVVPFEAAPDRPAGAVVAVDVGPGFDEPAAPAATYPALISLHNDTTGVLMAALTAGQAGPRGGG